MRILLVGCRLGAGLEAGALRSELRSVGVLIIVLAGCATTTPTRPSHPPTSAASAEAPTEVRIETLATACEVPDGS